MHTSGVAVSRKVARLAFIVKVAFSSGVGASMVGDGSINNRGQAIDVFLAMAIIF